MKTFKQFLAYEAAKKEAEFKALKDAEKIATEKLSLLEHETYKRIPSTKNSCRIDSGNTNTLTDKHAHVFAKLKGGGKELYSVTIKGFGHDGYSGTEIPSTHADYFRGLGFEIKDTNILESIDLAAIAPDKYVLLLPDDADDADDA
ncbi:MAG: hypothetical protein ABIO74_03345 [Dokdonella sp.]